MWIATAWLASTVVLAVDAPVEFGIRLAQTDRGVELRGPEALPGGADAEAFARLQTSVASLPPLRPAVLTVSRDGLSLAILDLTGSAYEPTEVKARRGCWVWKDWRSPDPPLHFPGATDRVDFVGGGHVLLGEISGVRLVNMEEPDATMPVESPDPFQTVAVLPDGLIAVAASQSLRLGRLERPGGFVEPLSVELDGSATQVVPVDGMAVFAVIVAGKGPDDRRCVIVDQQGRITAKIPGARGVEACGQRAIAYADVSGTQWWWVQVAPNGTLDTPTPLGPRGLELQTASPSGKFVSGFRSRLAGAWSPELIYVATPIAPRGAHTPVGPDGYVYWLSTNLPGEKGR